MLPARHNCVAKKALPSEAAASEVMASSSAGAPREIASERRASLSSGSRSMVIGAPWRVARMIARCTPGPAASARKEKTTTGPESARSVSWANTPSELSSARCASSTTITTRVCAASIICCTAPNI